jgi:hypothetical protein
MSLLVMPKEMQWSICIRYSKLFDKKCRNQRRCFSTRALGVMLLLPLLNGCVAAAFLTGQGEKVKAQYKLSDGPILVFIDDKNERIDWPAARRFLWDDLSQELIRTKSTLKVIPIETEDAIRQTNPDFGKLSCRKVGELAGADEVLWIEVQDFLVPEQITDATNAAYFNVTVKVVDPKQTERSKIRLWPTSPEGQLVTANMTGGAVLEQKTKDAKSRILTAKLAVEIARLFHDHKTETKG